LYDRGVTAFLIMKDPLMFQIYLGANKAIAVLGSCQTSYFTRKYCGVNTGGHQHVVEASCCINLYRSNSTRS
jgi:hypothetical protein